MALAPPTETCNGTPDRERLHGIVEVDETYVGGARPGKRGRGADNKVLVIVAVEDTAVETGKQGMGRIRLSRVLDASAASLLPFIERNIQGGSRVRIDGWTGYASMSAAGYDHAVVESKNIVITHLAVSLLKRWLLGTYQGAVKAHQLDYYLDEFTFRFNRRTSASRGKLFYRLVQQSVNSDPVPGREIVGGNPLTKPAPSTLSLQNADEIEF